MLLSAGELERLRLVLSTFQDGSGWEKINGNSVVGFRQFERALAEIINGVADENKALFDVLADRATPAGIRRIGFSCKLKRALEATVRRQTVYIEVSNAVAQFKRHLATIGLHTVQDYVANPALAGQGVLDWIAHLHHQDALTRNIDLPSSVYVILLYDRTATHFQLFEIAANVFLSGTNLVWTSGGSHLSASLNGDAVIDYYWNAGQLKFYVPLALCTWHSPVFTLEPLPAAAKTLESRADDMFPALWAQAVQIP